MSRCRLQIVLDDMSSKQVAFPKGSPMPNTKNVIFRQSGTFFLDILFIDPDDSGDQLTVQSTYMIGPFQSHEGPMEVNVEVKLMGFWLSCVIDSAGMGDTIIPVVKYRALTSAKKIAKLASILDEETKRRLEIEKTLQEERIEQQNLQESKATLELQLAECKTLLETNTKQHEELQTVLEDSLKSTQDSLDWARNELQMLQEELQIETEKTVNASKFEEQILLSNVHIAVVEHRLAESETLHETTRKQYEELETTLWNEVQKVEKLKNSLDAETNRRIQVEESLEKDSKAVFEFQLAELQTERDSAVKERDNALKRVDELYQRKPGRTSGHVVNFTEFSHSELNKATNNFNNSLKIGEGGYGSVYKGFLRFMIVAIKVLKPESKQGDTEFNKEVEILNKIRHPNLVSLIGASPEAQALIYEFIPNGSLNTFLTNGKNSSQNLSWRDRIRIASEICSTLIFLHSVQPHGIVHGDLKPENILLDSNLVSRISDFGISQVLHQTGSTKTPVHFTNNPQGTIAYIDPEYLSYGRLTPQSDTFSFGAIMLQLVTGRHAPGLKKFVKDALKDDKLDTIVDGSAGEWPIEEAKKMILLGLSCYVRKRRKRPDLAKVVWPAIESMKKVAGFHIIKEVFMEQQTQMPELV